MVLGLGGLGIGLVLALGLALALARALALALALAPLAKPQNFSRARWPRPASSVRGPASMVEMAHRMLEVGPYVVSLWLHTATDPPLDAFLAAAEQIGAQRVPASRLRVFVVSDGGAPDARQRKALVEVAFQRQPVKIAVVTTAIRDSPLKRGVVTALTWLIPTVRVVAPDRFRDALAHVDLDGRERVVWDAFAPLQRALPPSTNLALIAAARGYSPHTAAS